MTKQPLSIGARLALGYGAFFLLMIALTALAAGRVGEIDRALDHINDVTRVKQRYAFNFRASVHERAIALRDVVLATDAAHAAAPIGLIKTLDDNYARAASPMDALFHELPDILPAERDALAAIKEQERRTRPLIDRVVALHAAGQAGEAAALLSQQAAPAFVDWRASINGFIALQEKLDNEDAAGARRMASGFFGWMVLLCMCALVTGAFSAWVIARGLRRQFDREALMSRQVDPPPDGALRGAPPVSQVADTTAAIDATSKKIVDLIGVADGLAFQTSILALNAAAEAVRADGQGRVSTIAATEVRKLAQRSAAAAREIRELFKSSVERVEAGARLVDEAGARMDDIVASVRRVTGLLGEIGHAGAGDRIHDAQVDGAIGHMNEAICQNAVLVQQATTAATSLEVQAERLAQAVSALRLDAGQQPQSCPTLVGLADC